MANYSWATKYYLDYYLRDYLFKIIIDGYYGYQWLYLYLLIATDLLTLCTVNLSLLADLSNMHTIQKIVAKYYCLFCSKTIFCKNDFEAVF